MFFETGLAAPILEHGFETGLAVPSLEHGLLHQLLDFGWCFPHAAAINDVLGQLFGYVRLLLPNVVARLPRTLVSVLVGQDDSIFQWLTPHLHVPPVLEIVSAIFMGYYNTLTLLGQGNLSAGILAIGSIVLELNVAESTSIPISKEPTGISSVKLTPDASVFFDLQGRHIQGEPQGKGVYVRGGKKYVKK